MVRVRGSGPIQFYEETERTRDPSEETTGVDIHEGVMGSKEDSLVTRMLFR